jgi:transcription initiation factor TFIIB
MPEEKKSEPIQAKCPECGSEKRAEEGSEICCGGCGLVLGEDTKFYKGHERAYGEEEVRKRARSGSPTTLLIHDKGLSTIIDGRNRDAGGKRFDSNKRVEMYILRKWQSRIRVKDANERSLALALSALTRQSSALNIPKYGQENASNIYQKACKKRLVRGRSIGLMIAASLYFSCRQCGIPKTLDEIAEKTGYREKDIGRNYRLLLEVFGYPNLPLQTGEAYTSSLSNKMEVSGKSQALANKIINAARENKIPPFIFVVEEAHQFAPEGEERSAAISKNIIETIAREGRKFNACLVLVSQRPIQLSTTALSQCNTSILLRIVNPYDIKHITESCEGITSDIMEMLPGLRVGEAIITGGAVNFPLLVQVKTRKTKSSEKLGVNLEDVSINFLNLKEKNKEDLKAFS